MDEWTRQHEKRDINTKTDGGKNTRNLTVCLSLRSAREGLGCGRLPLLSSLPPLLRPLRAGICGNAQHDRVKEEKERECYKM